MKRKLDKTDIVELKMVLDDTTKTKEERKVAAMEIQDQRMNPVLDTDFNPETFDPMSDVENYEILKRPRVAPPARLETFGMKPKKCLEGQMIGMYESKQDLYLMMAHYINNLLDRVEELEKKIAKDKI